MTGHCRVYVSFNADQLVVHKIFGTTNNVLMTRRRWGATGTLWMAASGNRASNSRAQPKPKIND